MEQQNDRNLLDRYHSVLQTNHELQRKIAELEGSYQRAEEERTQHAELLTCLQRIDMVMDREADLDIMLRKVMDTVVDIFDCDRAWLLYPCDPDTPSFRVPIESTKPQYPGALARDSEISMEPSGARHCRQALAKEGPITAGPGNETEICHMTHKQFGVQSQMFMAIHPKTGKPWIAGVHQCSHARVWTPWEQKLFREICRRFGDSLNSLLFFRDLCQSSARYKRLVETMNEGLYVLDENAKVTYANPRFCDMVGCRLDELKGRRLDSFLANDESVQKVASASRKREPDCRYELEWNSTDGRVVPTFLSPGMLFDNGAYRGSFAVITDISEQKRAEREKRKLEAQLRQAHKMEAIGTLAGGIAHDFNNILAAILGYTDLIRNELDGTGDVLEMLDEVTKAGCRAKDLVRHILTFSRKTDIERQPIRIGLIVKEALKLLRASIPATIDIRMNIATRDGAILADPTQIHQVLINVCANAAQAMEETGGSLQVDLLEVSLAQSNEAGLGPGSYVQLSIADTGPGIQPGIVDRIFDPYFTTKKMGRGSGMGLATVHGIVQDHDGAIVVDNNPGEGVCFHMYFPRVQGPEQREAHGKRPQLPAGTERILVVDDEENVVNTTLGMLLRLGYDVTGETDSCKALELFLSRPDAFDLVLTDQTMPRMTGDQLAQRVISIRPDIPVILWSGYSAQVDPETCKRIGVKAFALKPLSLHELACQVRDVLDAGQEGGLRID